MKRKKIPEPDQFLTVAEAAAVIRIDVTQVRRLVRRGTIEGVKMGPRLWLVKESSAFEYRDKPYTNGRPRKGNR